MQRKLAIALTSGLMLSTCLAAPARAQNIGGIISMFMHAGPHYGYSHHRHYGYGYGYAPRRHYGYGYGYGHAHTYAYGYGYGARRYMYTPSQRDIAQPDAPVNPTSPSEPAVVSNPVPVGVVGADDLVGAGAYVPIFLPPRPPLAPHGEGPSPEPAHIPPADGQVVKMVLSPSTSSFEAEIGNFNNRVAEVGAPAIDREKIVATLNEAYASAAVARLEILPDEGWTREILQAHVLRRAEDILAEFSANLAGDAKTRDQTLAQLFSRAASEALPSALTEQEAVAFSASLKRYAQSRISASETRGLGVAAAQVVTAADADEVDADAATLLDAVDTQFQRPDLGLRGKLRARRIVLDCLTESKAKPATPAANPAVVPTSFDGRPDCADRVRAEFSAPSKMAPAPSEAVWTQQGPIFRGQKWQMALDGG